MSRKSNTALVQDTEISSTVELTVVKDPAVQLAENTARIAALKEQLKAAKETSDLRVKDAALQARNPAFVAGSLRKATESDKATLGVHCHGLVGDVKCSVCGAIRVCNSQDLFQVHACKGCVKVLQSAVRKDKSFEKRNSKEAIEAKIAALTAKLEARIAAIS